VRKYSLPFELEVILIFAIVWGLLAASAYFFPPPKFIRAADPSPSPTPTATSPLAGPTINSAMQAIARYYDPQGQVVCYILEEPDPGRRWSAISCLPACMVADVSDLHELPSCVATWTNMPAPGAVPQIKPNPAMWDGAIGQAEESIWGR